MCHTKSHDSRRGHGHGNVCAAGIRPASAPGNSNQWQCSAASARRLPGGLPGSAEGGRHRSRRRRRHHSLRRLAIDLGLIDVGFGDFCALCPMVGLRAPPAVDLPGGVPGARLGRNTPQYQWLVRLWVLLPDEVTRGGRQRRLSAATINIVAPATQGRRRWAYGTDLSARTAPGGPGLGLLFGHKPIALRLPIVRPFDAPRLRARWSRF